MNLFNRFMPWKMSQHVTDGVGWRCERNAVWYQLSTYYGVTYVWTDIFPILNKFFIISMKNVMHDCSFGLAIHIGQMLWSDLKIAYFLYYLIEAQIQINLKWNVSVCVCLKFNRERANINMADGHADGCSFIGWFFTVHFPFFWTAQATKTSKRKKCLFEKKSIKVPS